MRHSSLLLVLIPRCRALPAKLAAIRCYDMLDLRALIHPLLARLAGELRETTHMGRARRGRGRLSRQDPGLAHDHDVAGTGARAKAGRLAEIGEFLRRTVAGWSDGRAPAGPS